MSLAVGDSGRLGRFSRRGATPGTPWLGGGVVARSLQAELLWEEEEAASGVSVSQGGAPLPPLSHKRNGVLMAPPGGKRWPARACSVLCCLLAVSALAFLLAIGCLVLKDLRTEKEKNEDGIETGLLGFWGLFVLALMTGLSCCSFSWTVTYFDSFEPGMFPPTPLSPARFNHHMDNMGTRAPSQTQHFFLCAALSQTEKGVEHLHVRHISRMCVNGGPLLCL
ncbi:ADP-ribosylation factor-like protein 6-interacting protein 6 isoform X1 [Chelonia mydas]|uniref:ADP-ribosylation factor-like protein 6-interacting protein 6 isoform X1 n=1 Tax=Chelonia mydas TaxID=8469 RepID=UPI0018A1DE1B|nr:ADP-ribosylation factor-like protein 6-interacting protein 6 isoform X1 [Chelonia mydas]